MKQHQPHQHRRVDEAVADGEEAGGVAGGVEGDRGQVGGRPQGGAQEEDVREDRRPGGGVRLGEAGVEEVGPVDEHDDEVGAGADELGEQEGACHLLVDTHAVAVHLLAEDTIFS